MSERSLVSSRTALGVFCGGMLLLFAGCAFIYDFDGYDDGLSAGSLGSGGAGVSTADASAASGAQSGGGGSGGSACDPVEAPECGINILANVSADAEFGDIALGDKLMFWVQNSTVQMRSKDTSAPTPVKLPINAAVKVLHVAAADDSALYAASNDYVIKVPIPGDSVDLIEPIGMATGLAVYNGELYWYSDSPQKLKKGQPGSVVALSDTTGLAPALIAAGKGGSDLVFWTYKGSGPKTGGVRRLNKAADIASAQDQPSGITTDGKDVYWVTVDGVIHSAPIDGEVMPKDGKAMPAGITMPSGRIVESGANVYWLSPDTETCVAMPCDCTTHCNMILMAPKADIANATVFAQGAWPKLRGLAADESNVYWTAGTGKAWLLLQKAVLP